MIERDHKSEIRTLITESMDQLFPEREIHVRTGAEIKFMRITQMSQILGCFVFLLIAGWAGFTSISYTQHAKVVYDKDYEIASARLAYQSLLSEVEVYQRKFTSITRNLEENNSLMLGLVEKNASLQQNIRSVSKVLAITESERERIHNNRENLKADLALIDTRMNGVINKNLSLRSNLDVVEINLQAALSERNRALFEGTRMNREINNLETRLSSLQLNQESSIQKLADRTNSYIDGVESVVSSTGLNVDKVLVIQDKNKKTALGGPFIPVQLDGLPADRLKASLSNLDYHLNRWEGLQELVKRLPLSPPLHSYRITSSFGKRRDPMNKRWAAHYGTDMAGPMNSSIKTPSAGVVTYAGWKGNYGKFIEIDHGAGIKTRYGHLNKIYVKKGQKVKFKQKIGLLGSTGRSTGAHLHYEVSFLGKNMNPVKFIKAGQYVFKE